MNIKYIYIIFLICGIVSAQEYPVEILPGDTVNIESGSDTLMVITFSQFEKTLIAGEQLKICELEKVEYQSKIVKLEEIAELDSIKYSELKSGYDHYVEKWKSSDEQLENAEVDLAEQRRLKYIFGAAGAALGLLIGILI